MEWACLFFALLGFREQGARMPKPRRVAGVLATFGILGLVAEGGAGGARIAAAAGGVFTLALAMSKAVAGPLFVFLRQVSTWFGQPAEPQPSAQPAVYQRAIDRAEGVV